MTERYVYLNNARISPCPRPTLDRVRSALAREHEYGWTIDEQQTSMLEARTSLADMLGSDPGEIAITQSATYSFNLLVNGLSWRERDNIVLTDLAYRSIAEASLRLERDRGVEVRFVPTRGWVSRPEEILAAVNERTRLVVVPMLPLFCGVVQPVEEIGILLSDVPARFVINATQAVGQLPISVRALRCDYLFGTSRKWLRGPRGLGFLYVRAPLIASLRPSNLGYPAASWTEEHEFALDPSVDRLHAGDYPYALLDGLSESVRYALRVGIDRIARRNADLGRLCRDRLAAVRGVEVYDQAHGSTGTVPIGLREVDADTVVRTLRCQNIVACALYEENALVAFRRLGQTALVRLSLHYFNTEGEVEILADALTDLVMKH